MGRAYEYRRASKEKRWDKMSKLFPKLAKNITIAAKEGGADPDLNAKLRTAILNAKAQNMPKDNIEAAIKRAAGKDSENFSEISYEGKGPHGVLVFVECATDNNTRTVANVKHISINMEAEQCQQGHWNLCFPVKQFLSLNCLKVKILKILN